MKYRMHLSRDLFEYLDFSEALLIFACPKVLPEEISFEVWGATLVTSTTEWPDSLKRPPVDFDAQQDDIYVAGYGQITVPDVVGGELCVKLYEPGLSPTAQFVRLPNGEELTLRRRWNNKHAVEAYSYEMYCVLDWPLGYCHFSLLARGAVSFEFRLEDCIPLQKYIKQPEMYGFRSELR